MGPFPHDAAPAEITIDNPAGTDGFEFVEFAHPEPEKLRDLFARMGPLEQARQVSLCFVNIDSFHTFHYTRRHD